MLEPMDTAQAIVAKDSASIDLERRLMTEINLLKLEGLLFCLDPRAARQRSGTVTLQDARREPVTITIDPNYGQPSVLAYKVLQAILLKLTEEGIADWQDSRPVFGDRVSFSQRELSVLVGRSWSGRTSQQLFEAVMQLRTTQIFARLYDKASDDWTVANFQLLNSALFAGRDKTLSQCAVRLAPEIIDSINRQHVAFFNLQRLRALEPIGLVLYKRVFYNLSVLNRPGQRRQDLKFTKDYAALCREWLGGLKVLRYRSDIVKDQLGRHLDQLEATGLIRRWAIAKNAGGDGFNVAFWPGQGSSRITGAIMSSATSRGGRRCRTAGTFRSRWSWSGISIRRSATSTTPSRATRRPMPTSCWSGSRRTSCTI